MRDEGGKLELLACMEAVFSAVDPYDALHDSSHAPGSDGHGLSDFHEDVDSAEVLQVYTNLLDI